MHASFCCLVVSTLLAATAAPASARIERIVERSFAVSGTGRLYVDTEAGEIRVEPGEASTVQVRARQRIAASTEAEADELLRKLQLTFEQKGNDIRVISRYERRIAAFNFGSWPPVKVDFVVKVPRAYESELVTSGGPIVVGSLDGKASARTSGGSIRFGQMGATVIARTSGGSISLDGARGSVELRTSGGNITAGEIAGTAELSTSGGSIRAESVAGAIRASTSGGSIRAGLTGPLTGDSHLSTSGGSLRLNLDSTAAFQLDASTSGGHVDADGLTIKLEKGGSRNRLAGAVNGGGPLVKLRTSGGGIEIRGRN